MPNLDTVQSITDNLVQVLKGAGINTVKKNFNQDPAASDLPLIDVIYDTENLGYDHGQKPLYNDIVFILRMFVKDNSPSLITTEKQRLIHIVRDNVTINALNINELSSSLLVSKVVTGDIDTSLSENDLGIIEYELEIRYREL